MRDLSLVNDRVIDFLKKEYNEVIYKAWICFSEGAKFEEDNIIIVVPNQYVKRTFQERYLSDVEATYRNIITFSKLIIRTETENEYIKNTLYKQKYFEKIMLSSTEFSVYM